MGSDNRASGRAAHERNPQAVSAVPVGIPDAEEMVAIHFRDVAVVQPLLEPLISKFRKVGQFAAFLYIRTSCFAVGFDLMAGGAMIHLGPIAIGAVKIRTFEEWAEEQSAKAIEARRAETGTGSVHESASGSAGLPESDPPTPRPEAGEGVE